MERMRPSALADRPRNRVPAFDPTERKRKGYPKEERPFYTAAIDYKRLRGRNERQRSEPLSLGTVVESHSEGHIPKDDGKGISIVPSKYGVSNGQSRRSEGHLKTGRAFHFDPFETGSVVSTDVTGPGNTSTLTSASIGEGECVLPPSFSQRASYSNGYVLDASVAGRLSANRRGKKLKTQTRRERWKEGISDHARSEVLSNDVKTVPSGSTFCGATRETIPSFTFRDASPGNLVRETEATCPSDSGCSTVNRAESDRTKGTFGQGVSKLPRSSSSGRLRSSSFQEQGTSVVTDWGSPNHRCSPFASRSHYKRYVAKESSLAKKMNDLGSGVTSSGGGLTEDGRTGTVTFVSEDPGVECASSSATSTSSGSSKPSDPHQNLEGQSSMSKDYESENDLGPTFVLSSGRLSQEEEKKIGIRPSTIDDDFDKYFSQLVL